MMCTKQASAEKELEKNEELKQDHVKNLQEWAEKQPHLPQLTDLQLILFMHSCYYSQEAAKVAIDNYFTCRTHCPEFFSNRTPNTDLKNGLDVGLYYVLPGCTKEGYKVIYCRLVDPDPEKYFFAEQLKVFTMVMDIWFVEEGPDPGFIILFDMTGVAFGHLKKLGIMTMKKYMFYLQEAMPVRLKGLHFIHVVPFMDKILALMKPFMKKDLLDVLYLHTEGLDSLSNVLHTKYLPKELGGSAPNLKQMHDYMLQSILDHSDYFTKEEKQRIDESKRPGKAKIGGDIFGVEGSFKKLDID